MWHNCRHRKTFDKEEERNYEEEIALNRLRTSVSCVEVIHDPSSAHWSRCPSTTKFVDSIISFADNYRLGPRQRNFAFVLNCNCIVKKNIVTWLLKAGIVEPEETSIAGKWLGTHFIETTANNESTVGTGVIRWVCHEKCRRGHLMIEGSRKWVEGLQFVWEEKTLFVLQLQRDWYNSCVKIRCQETDNGDCNRLRTLVCVTVKCKMWKSRHLYSCL
jgi:hypothetical protein